MFRTISRALARLATILTLSGTAFLVAPSSAQTVEASSEGSPAISARLVATQNGVEPGRSIEVALRIRHGPGWNSFWRNPGAGEATRIEWVLPAGWSAGDIAWPAPELVYDEDGAIFGHGYGDLVYLPLRIGAPPDVRPGQTVRLTASATWLACRAGECENGEANLTLRLPVVTESRLNADVQSALQRQVMPEWRDDWSVAAGTVGEKILFRLTTGETILDPHFFPATEMVWHDADQLFESGADGELVGHLPVDPFYDGNIATLTGVLVYRDESGGRRAISIRTPVQAGAPSASAADAGGQRGADHIIVVLAFALLGGLILNLMPCVLPVLSVKALILSQSSGAGVRALRADGAAYGAGVIASFLAVGGLMLVLRSALGEIGWGFQLQHPAVIMALALLMVAVGLNLLGLFEIGGSMQRLGGSLTAKTPLVSSFLTGMLAVVLAAPCTAPFMASALGAALVQPPTVALAIFGTMGLGLALPYLVLSFLPAARRLLPKPGGWMITFRQALAFPMFATAIWLLWVLGGQTGADGMAAGLAALLTLSIALWAFTKGPGGVWRSVAVAALLSTGVVTFGVARHGLVTGSENQQAAGLFDETPYSPEALDDLLASGVPVFAYFTADWCVTCKANEAAAIQRAETAAFFEDRNISVIVGDWTRPDPMIAAILEDYGRAGVPMYVYYPPGTTRLEGVLLPQVLTVDILRESIETAPEIAGDRLQSE